jgi:hypothetical protein
MPALQPEFDKGNWRTAKGCDGGACIMVGHQDQAILVGDTARPNGPYIVYTRAAWREFVRSVEQGDFDRPV